MIQVTNIGTNPNTYRSAAMLNCWREYHGIVGGVECCVLDCHAWAKDGAHVTIGRGTKVYIVPMCHKHNCQFGKTLWVREKDANPVRLTSLR